MFILQRAFSYFELMGSPLTHALPIWALLSLLGATWRYRFTGNHPDNPLKQPVGGRIFCFWHSQILQFAYGFRGCNILTVVSASRDGDIATEIAQRWGNDAIRGSSNRGGIGALRGCVSALRSSRNIAIVPDGPKGPPRIAKAGVAQIARLAKAPVIPVYATPSRTWRLKSWDRFEIPKIGATISVDFGNPLFAPDSNDSQESIDTLTAQIQESLSR